MRFLLKLLIAFCTTAPIFAQEVSKSIMSDAAHCVVYGDQDWLEGRQHSTVTLSAVFDTISYPKRPYLILLVHTGRRSGQAFSIQMDKIGNKRAFMIQNNADFEMIGRHVSYTNPPLGGVWTQNHLSKSIAKAMTSRLYTLPMSSLTVGRGDIECSSYVSESQ